MNELLLSVCADRRSRSRCSIRYRNSGRQADDAEGADADADPSRHERNRTEQDEQPFHYFPSLPSSAPSFRSKATVVGLGTGSWIRLDLPIATSSGVNPCLVGPLSS